VTRITAHDQGFVAAPPSRLYGVLAEIASYGSWWPGVRVDTQEDGFRLDLGAGGARARPEGRRPDVGLVIRLGPPYGGTLEWYLEPFEEGTIVNSIVDLEVAGGQGRSGRLLRRLRSGVRRGLVGLKGTLEPPRKEPTGTVEP
jgi:hypothetical protein